MKIVIILAILVFFTFGWLASNVYSDISNKEFPLSFNSNEKASPHDWIKEKDIEVYNDKVVINVKNPSWATYADTNSMDPLLDMGANGIEIVPKSEEDIHVGDVIAYDSEYGLIVHRVIEKSNDEEGFYAITKGDNNSKSDPYKVRFDQIKFILVGVIY